MNRTDIANFIKAATPTPPSLGLPLPEFFNVHWPQKVTIDTPKYPGSDRDGCQD